MIDSLYLWWGGWLEDSRGWFHPPNCIASFPIDVAVRMARKDEASGLRMTPADLLEYHREAGLRTDGAETFYLAGPGE